MIGEIAEIMVKLLGGIWSVKKMTNNMRSVALKRINNKYYKWSADGPVYFDKGEWILENNFLIVESLKGKL